MLIIVLVLVLVAFGLLVGALTTANTLFAWISVAVSVAAAAILVVDWVRSRRTRSAARSAPAVADDHLDDEPEPARAAGPDPVRDGSGAGGAEPEPGAAGGPGDEPAEEATDASDLLVVSDLDAEVRVLDERPRYHLGRCSFIAGKPSLTLPVAEARQLGFTPCALCTPDAVLAARHREGRGTEQPNDVG
ncbi:hypothetical protein L6E12_02210 [Actinokineospora sp. PR83]|uniref:hypothetical protein n=1 Tax=Actinokineospora sp. PR83 TaxID=2884908 RepID=UPI0027DEE99A|nr:hypothetical protein [Actinokineospora sp. PR83]MCG8914608.1 hypothetical protein [Actinokineospora sp. PR83]